MVKNLVIDKINIQELKLAVVGLGYVGLPLAVELSKHFNVTGYDIDKTRISELKRAEDRTGEIETGQITDLKKCNFTSKLSEIKNCEIFIITVPTPVDEFKMPDLKPLKQASEDIGNILSAGNLVIFESTVYPGVTQNICAKIIEKKSGLVYNKEFYCGYSPERINPGDKTHTINKVIKLVSGSTPEVADLIEALYSKIVSAGVHKTSSIEVAEAAKVIENIQRDVNIALINEFSKIFDALNLPTNEVLDAAATKWNFLNFRPGLVGGHCIGVDPYYLTYVSNSVGQHPELISAARRINDNMCHHWALKFLKKLQNKDGKNSKRVLVMGATFKENCPDTRNSKTFEFANIINDFGYEIDIYDPVAHFGEEISLYKSYITDIPTDTYDGIAILVAHTQFKEMGIKKIRSFCCDNGIIFDLKSCFHSNNVEFQI